MSEVKKKRGRPATRVVRVTGEAEMITMSREYGSEETMQDRAGAIALQPALHGAIPSFCRVEFDYSPGNDKIVFRPEYIGKWSDHYTTASSGAA